MGKVTMAILHIYVKLPEGTMVYEQLRRDTLWCHEPHGRLENVRTEWGLSIGTSPINGPFSVAMFDYRRVSRCINMGSISSIFLQFVEDEFAMKKT